LILFLPFVGTFEEIGMGNSLIKIVIALTVYGLNVR
ncbi:MAG: uncharacterized membrane protein YqaE (UPF0057 family), partial [Akkermansiaceae bacterium]